MRQCTAITSSGTRCQRLIAETEEHCFGHDPSKAAQRKQLASSAAKAKGAGSEIARIKERLKEIAEGILSGEMDKARGSVTVQAYGVLKGYLELERRGREEQELEQLKEHVARLETMATNVKRLRG